MQIVTHLSKFYKNLLKENVLLLNEVIMKALYSCFILFIVGCSSEKKTECNDEILNVGSDSYKFNCQDCHGDGENIDFKNRVSQLKEDEYLDIIKYNKKGNHVIYSSVSDSQLLAIKCFLELKSISKIDDVDLK